MATYLVTGMAGGMAQRAALRLIEAGHDVVGVDYRKAPQLEGRLAGVKTYKANYNKTSIEDVFRWHAFDGVLHLGRVGNLKESPGKRFDLNVVGSRKLLDLCLAHKVKRLVVLSTFHIYGAHPANHIPISEDEPLRAGFDFPQLADAIQLDNMASTWIYRFPEVQTVVLRPTNVVGPTIQNTMSRFLRQRRVPHVMGFNPMTQFLHEDDLASAVVTATLGDHRGVYNLAGPAVLPWRTALQLAGAETFPIPSALADAYLRLFASSFPAYLLNFFKYPCVLTDARFREDFRWQPSVDIRHTISSTVGRLRGVARDAWSAARCVGVGEALRLALGVRWGAAPRPGKEGRGWLPQALSPHTLPRFVGTPPVGALTNPHGDPRIHRAPNPPLRGGARSLGAGRRPAAPRVWERWGRGPHPPSPLSGNTGEGEQSRLLLPTGGCPAPAADGGLPGSCRRRGAALLLPSPVFPERGQG